MVSETHFHLIFLLIYPPFLIDVFRFCFNRSNGKSLSYTITIIILCTSHVTSPNASFIRIKCIGYGWRSSYWKIVCSPDAGWTNTITVLIKFELLIWTVWLQSRCTATQFYVAAKQSFRFCITWHACEISDLVSQFALKACNTHNISQEDAMYWEFSRMYLDM